MAELPHDRLYLLLTNGDTIAEGQGTDEINAAYKHSEVSQYHLQVIAKKIVIMPKTNARHTTS